MSSIAYEACDIIKGSFLFLWFLENVRTRSRPMAAHQVQGCR
jgi:hypothetical protein